LTAHRSRHIICHCSSFSGRPSHDFGTPGAGHVELFLVGPFSFVYGIRKMPAPVLQEAFIPCLRAS